MNKKSIEQKAKRIFTVGTKFIPAHINTSEYCIITKDSTFEWHDNTLLSVIKSNLSYVSNKGTFVTDTASGEYGNTLYSRVVYSGGSKRFAQILVQDVKQKEDKMKDYYFNYTYKGGRVITICILQDSEGVVRAGYSIKIAEDIHDDNLAKTISSGRASNDRTNLLPTDAMISPSISNRHMIGKLAEGIMFKIEKGLIKIKGLKN